MKFGIFGKINLEKLPFYSAVVALSLMLVRVFFFYSTPESMMVTVVPDDAFYYLTLAKNKAFIGYWTFDGVTPATGFHLLYGYLLVSIYWILGDIGFKGMYLFIGICAACSIAVAVWLTGKAASTVYGKSNCMFAIIPFFTFVALIQSTMMMESWLVILFSALTVFLSFSLTRISSGFGTFLIGVGLLGSLSRADYGLLPGIIFSAFLIDKMLFSRSNNIIDIRRSGLILFGAFIGVGSTLLHNYIVSGNIAQMSAQVKLHWSTEIGHNIGVPVYLFSEIILPTVSENIKIVGLAFVAILLAYSAICAINMRKRFPSLQIATIAFTSSVGVIACYVLFYRQNSQALQIWYSANFLVPIGFAFAGVSYFLLKRHVVTISGFLLFSYLSVGLYYLIRPHWPHQVGMYNAAIYLKRLPEVTYGAWNAGVISYFSGKHVINIDGLVNDDVFPYIKTNRLFDYLILRKIEFLVDYEEMFLNEEKSRRGGYLEPRVEQCIAALAAVDGDVPKWGRGPLRIYKVDLRCK